MNHRYAIELKMDCIRIRHYQNLIYMHLPQKVHTKKNIWSSVTKIDAKQEVSLSAQFGVNFILLRNTVCFLIKRTSSSQYIFYMWRLVSLTLYTGAQISRRSRRHLNKTCFAFTMHLRTRFFQRVTFLQFKKEHFVYTGFNASSIQLFIHVKND